MSNIVERLCDIVKVVGVEPSNGDTAVHRHVDAVFLTEFVHLVFVQAGIGEHTNLAGGVAPVMFVAKVLELFDKSRSHFFHAGRHHNKIVVPHFG